MERFVNWLIVLCIAVDENDILMINNKGQWAKSPKKQSVRVYF